MSFQHDGFDVSSTHTFFFKKKILGDNLPSIIGNLSPIAIFFGHLR
jgi:hypothetical protein